MDSSPLNSREKPADPAVIRACREAFEQSLQRGESFMIEEVLEQNHTVATGPLLRALLEAEIQFHLHQGRAVQREAFELRFASHRQIVREVFRGIHENASAADSEGESVTLVHPLVSRVPEPGSGSGSGNDLETITPTAEESRLQAADDPQATVELPSSRSHSTAKDSVSISCPECHTRFSAFADPASSVSCPSCGSEYQLYADIESTFSLVGLYTLDKFELIRELGRGAFGVVYLANDTELQRHVAIKLPRQGMFTNPDDEERFLREARNTARLRHAGLVPVFEVGRTNKGPYIASEYVEGVTLADALTAGRFTFPEAAMLVVELAEAVQHAHTQGVIHRDLKPSNIILEKRERKSHDSSGQKSSMRSSQGPPDSRHRSLPGLEQRPRILDFGLARRDGTDQIAVTMEGQIVGTPAYMSPEQARGLGNQADRRCDIYSLGVILFELLTGERPFRGNTRMVIKQAAEDEPPKPRRLNSQIPRDLETICLKCMEKDAAKRYQHAQELADDLNRFLQDIPILARPISRFEYAWRWARRHTDIVYTAAGLTLVIVAVTATAFALITASRNAEHAARVGAEALAEENLLLYDSERDAHTATERSRRTARRAIDSFMVGLSDSLKYYPGVEEARRQMLEQAVRNYEAIAHTGSDQAALEMERGRALQKLGDAHRALGNLDQAAESYTQSEAIFSSLLTQFDDPWECQLEAARARMNLALTMSQSLATAGTDAEKASERIDTVDRHYGQAIELLQNLLAQNADRPAAHELLMTTILNRALFLASLDRRSEARRLLASVEERSEALLLSKSSHELVSTLVAAQTALGHLLTAEGLLAEARAKFEAAIANSNELVRQRADKFDAVNQRAVTRIYLAGLFNQLGELGQEAETYRQTLADYDALLEKLPDSPIFRENAALVRTDYGQLLLDMVQYEQAEQELKLALAAFLKLQQQAPQAVRNYENAAACQDMLAELYWLQSRLPEASSACDQSIAVFQWMAEELPDFPRYRERLAVALARQGRILLKQGNLPEGRERFAKAVELLIGLSTEAGEVTSYRFALAMTHSRYAESLAAIDDAAGVANVASEAARHWNQLGQDSSVPKHLFEAAWFFLTTSHAALREPKLARELAQQASDMSPANPDYHMALGVAAYRLGEAAKARQSLAKAAELRQQWHGRELLFLALTQVALDQQDEAKASYDKALAWIAAHQPGSLELQRLAEECAAELQDINPKFEIRNKFEIGMLQ